MGLDLLRDSTVGQIVNYLSKGRLLPYADQRPGYVVPARFLASSERKPKETGSDVTTLCDEDREKKNMVSGTTTPAATELDRVSTLVPATAVEALEKQLTDKAGEIPDPYLIDWEEDDQDNPRSVKCRSHYIHPLILNLRQKLVLQEARLRRVQHQSADIQRLHWLCHLHVLHPWPDGRISCIAHDRHTRAHAIRPGYAFL